MPNRHHAIACRVPVLLALCLLSQPLWSMPEILIERNHSEGPDLIRARTRLPVPLERLLLFLEQPCHVRQWMPKLEEIRYLAQDQAPGQLVYIANHGNWLARGRDAVLRFTRTGKNPVQIEVRAEPNHLPHRDGFVRLPFSEAHWSLSEEQATTLLDYRQQVVLGGRVPQWLADRLSQRHVQSTLEALIEYAETIDSGDCPADSG